MARTRVRWRRVVLLAGLVVGTVALAGRAAVGSSGPPGAADRHVVRPGETLWEIARAQVGPEGDPRPLVAGIREANGLATSAVQAGQLLVVPDH